MNFNLYLDKFQKAADLLDKKLLSKKQMEVAVGIFHNSVFLKLFKTAWANKFPDALTSPSRIFFSVWVNDAIIKENKLFYNIHALKLSHLNGYAIASRDFADSFRKKFKPFEQQWENVSTKFGPLTLMQGWVNADLKNLEEETIKLANSFYKLSILLMLRLQNLKNEIITIMKTYQHILKLKERKRGFHLITNEIVNALPQINEIKTGICHVFIQHTSASLTINEKADPTVRKDFETFFNKVAPENDNYRHDSEGSDDMPAHLKSSLLGSSVTIPINNGELALGIWQGIYLCEHRDEGGERTLVITALGE
jgi:secondary thiamine-phosphate synthase enzyme